MSYLDTELQFFENNIKKVCPIGTLTLQQWLYSIKFPKKEIVTLFEKIEKASSDKNLQLKASLKGKLYYLTPASISDGKGRAYSNCVGFTGLAMLDFDNLEPDFAIELKKFIFETYPYIIASFLSVSKHGLKCIVRIPVVKTVEEYKSVYYGLLAEFEQFKGCDSAHSNAVLASYITYDRDLLYRTTATVFKGIGIRLNEFKEFDGEFEPLENVNPKDVASIKKQISNMLNQIEIEQTAHLKIRSLGLLIGGWAAYGYFDYDEIQEEVLNQMDGIQFLHKSMRTYKTTFKQMMVLGSKSPLKYENER